MLATLKVAFVGIIKKMGVMKAKWITILAPAISSFLFFLPLTGQAQWNVGIEYNMAFPSLTIVKYSRPVQFQP